MTIAISTHHRPRLPRWEVLAIFPVFILTAAGCTGAAPPGWGGVQVVPSNGVVYAAPGGRLYSLKPELRPQNPAGLVAEAGEWQFPPDKNLASYYAPPAVANSTVFAATSDGKLRAVDWATGQQLWEFPPPRTRPPGVLDQLRSFTGAAAPDAEYSLGLVLGTPTAAGDTVYVGGSNHRLYALDVKTGRRRWEFQTQDKIWSSPAVTKDTVYIGSLDHRLYAVDTSTGARRWEFLAGGAVASSPLVVQDTVYIGAADNKLYALDATTGAVRWTFTAGNWFWTRPAVSEGVLYAGSLDHRVYALDLRTGKEVWPQPFQEADQPIVAAPVVVGDIVVVAAGDGTVYGLDTRAGRKLWSYAVPNQIPVYSNITTDGVAAYVVALDNYLYALDVRSGQELWKFKGG